MVLRVWLGTWNIGSDSGKTVEVCEELRKKMIDVERTWLKGCLVWRGWRCRLWWSGKGDRIGGVGDKMNELCEKMVKVRIVSDRVMAVGLVVEQDVLSLTCGYVPQSGRSL